MKSEIKKRWVAALKSGKYTQGVGFLKNSGEHCCLGVLCEIAEEDGVVSSMFAGEVADYIKGLNFLNLDDTDDRATCFISKSEPAGDISDINLPKAVKIWAGLDTIDPYITSSPGNTHRISDCNDNLGLTFTQIADAIEEGL